MTHPALTPGATAIVTGGAAGIGLAAAARFAALGMNVCVADLGAERLAEAARVLAALDGGRIVTRDCDVSRPEDLEALRADVDERFGGVDVLMLNAGIQPGSALFGPEEACSRVLDVNLWGVIRGARTFGPGMIARGRPGAIIATNQRE